MVWGREREGSEGVWRGGLVCVRSFCLLGDVGVGRGVGEEIKRKSSGGGRRCARGDLFTTSRFASGGFW